MTKEEAMKLALFALDIVKIHYTQNRHINEAITALKEQLAQPEQEPVAHLWECLGRWSAYLVNNGTQAECAPPSWLVEAVKNATTPPQRTEQNFCPRCGKRTKDIHTCTPPWENT